MRATPKPVTRGARPTPPAARLGLWLIYVLPAAEKAVWRKAMLPLYQQYEDVVGKDTIQAIEKIVAETEKAAKK